MSNVAQDHRPRRSSGIGVQYTDGRAALVGGRGHGVYALNDTALALWELCDGETTPVEMVTAICEICAVPREIVETDVDRTLHELTAAGLLDGD